MSESNKIELPHAFTPREYQKPFIRAFRDLIVKRFILVWHRRAGKDKTCFVELPAKMFERIGAYYYLAPTYKQGKKIIWDNIDNDGFQMLQHIPKSIVKRRNETEMRVELVNGAYVQIIGTENLDALMGGNPMGIIFTEYSLHTPEVWNMLRPILAVNGGWAIFNYTPRGTNHAYKLLKEHEDDPNWFTQVLTVDDTHVLTPEDLEEEKKSMPRDLYEQEYYCKFIDGASQFFKGIEKCIYTEEPYEQPELLHEYKQGTDLGQVNDYTVITTIDLNTFKVGKQERFNHIDYNLQKSKILAKYYQFRSPTMTADNTGIGIPILDDLSKEITTLERYTFTEKTRMNLLVNLQILIEQQKIKIPNDPILIQELKSFEYILGAKGKVSAGCPENLHDDTVMSLALAVWGIPDKPLEIINPYHEMRLQAINDMSIDDKTGYLK